MVFGKPLNSQPVIRAKLASMISRVEACQNWFESITHQMNNVLVFYIDHFIPFCSPYIQMTYDETSDKLAGPIGLLKQYVRALYQFSLLTNFNQICITDRSRNCRRWDLLYELKLDVFLDVSVRADATQVFGGRALTMTGMGKIIEGVRFFTSFFLLFVSTYALLTAVPSHLGL